MKREGVGSSEEMLLTIGDWGCSAVVRLDWAKRGGGAGGDCGGGGSRWMGRWWRVLARGLLQLCEGHTQREYEVSFSEDLVSEEEFQAPAYRKVFFFLFLFSFFIYFSMKSLS